MESRLENMRVRKLTIYYYLEDKSIMISEPKQTNAGIPQGQFLKRMIVNKADGCPYMPQDFSIGIDLAINGRVMRLFDADDYTRRFYEVSFFQQLQNRSGWQNSLSPLERWNNRQRSIAFGNWAVADLI